MKIEDQQYSYLYNYAYNYYCNVLKQDNRISKLFGVLKLPLEYEFTNYFISMLLFAKLGSLVNSIAPLILLIFWLVTIRIKNTLNEKILNACIDEDTILALSFIENGVDPNYPLDPPYVTKSDRDYIYNCNSKCIIASYKNRTSIFLKIKKQIFYSLLIMINYHTILFLLLENKN